MTCKYSGIDWRDALYNAVRTAPGGVEEAARFLTERRGRSIHRETLRTKLRHIDGESISMEMAEMLTEWLQELRRDDALSWVHAFNGRFGLAAERFEPSSVGAQMDPIAMLRDSLLGLGVAGGRLTEIGVEVTADGRIDDGEADRLEEQVMLEIRQLMRLTRVARNAAAANRSATPAPGA